MTLRAVGICLVLGSMAMALYLLIVQPLGAMVNWGRIYLILAGLAPAMVVVGSMLLAALAPLYRLVGLAGCGLTAAGVILAYLLSSGSGAALDFGPGGTPLWLLILMAVGVLVCVGVSLAGLAHIMDVHSRSRGPALGMLLLSLMGVFVFITLAEKEPAMDLMLDSLKRGPEDVRKEALELFSRLPEERSHEGLRNLLESGDREVRIMSARALGLANLHMGALDELSDALLSEEDGEVIQELVSAMLATVRQGGGRERRIALGAFSLLLDRDETSKRLAGISGLRELGGERAWERLVDAMDDPEPRVVRAAYNSLKVLSGEDYGMDAVRWSKWLERKKQGLE